MRPIECLIIAILVAAANVQGRVVKRSIDLIASQGVVSLERLSGNIIPDAYEVEFKMPFGFDKLFKGAVKINVTCRQSTNKIRLHSKGLRTIVANVTQIEPPTKDPVLKVISENNANEDVLEILLEKNLEAKSHVQIHILFEGDVCVPGHTVEGLFTDCYRNESGGEALCWAATNFRPNHARKVFPCFDEPEFKARFAISIVRKTDQISLSNMALEKSEPLEDGFVRDRYQQTPLISTYSVAFHISSLNQIVKQAADPSDSSGVVVRVWGRPEYAAALVNVSEKVHKALKFLNSFWKVRYPLSKMDLVALPNYSNTRPTDNLGIIFFKESDLSSRGSWQVTHELVLQWLSAVATPYWWSETQITNALARYVTTYTTLQVSEGRETVHNWPMTMLYSLYYEFSKRYPHGKNTVIKHDSGSSKAELVFRMFNYTFGEETLNAALQKFMAKSQYKTYDHHLIWKTVQDEAMERKTLEDSVSVSEVAASWVYKDRLPVLTVTRNYEDNTAHLNQRIYLRERPHDVPDKDNFLWYIPIVVVSQSNLNFRNFTPRVWMKAKRDMTLHHIDGPNNFIIVNPEEIGPFPVNYDEKNWNLLAQFLQTPNRDKIPVNTRAKLLHDAWNLAYAGDLNFGVALNMTLFLKYEREFLAWNPIFSMIDHIGRHIDSSSVHKKFQTYVRILLTPLYEELGNESKEDESDGIENLRSSSKVFLCQAGYKPCIEEAQGVFDRWMEVDDPDEGNPVSNQYICPVFKWGTKEEWEFGLQRVINLPKSRKASERTYLLKTLAGCPIDSWKIEKLLNITILEQNGNFSDGDIYLIFTMLTGGAEGYTTLYHYLYKNWDTLKQRFEGKPHLWNTMITSATSVFKTQEGLDMVTRLYKDKMDELGTADFVVEKAIKNIKEETAWSNENLPVIEAWLDNFLRENNVEGQPKMGK